MNTFMVDPLEDGISCVEFIRAGGSDLDVINAARVSYGVRKEELDERDRKLIFYLIKHKHTSPFEHTQLVYRIKCPLYVARQWMRHRIGVSYNEISGRYTKIPTEFYVPSTWRIQDPVNKQGSIPAHLETDEVCRAAYKEVLAKAIETYELLLSQGVCRELARGVLPQCTYTEFIFTCNLISLFHFAQLRADSHAQWEIQQYAKALIEAAQIHFPVSVKSWQKSVSGC